MLWLIKIAISLGCGVCKYFAEIGCEELESIAIPIILICGVSYFSHVWWLGIPTALMVFDIKCLGYGIKGFGRKLFGEAGAQGFWMFGACFLAGLFPVIFKHVNWSWGAFAFYCIGAGIIGGISHNWNNKIWAPIKGIWMSVLLYFIH